MIQRPQLNDYPVFAGTYVNMVPDGADVMQLLTDSLTATHEIFTGLPDEKGLYAYAEGKWTVKEMLGHMIDTERIFAIRAFCISREQIVMPGFDQEVYVNNTDYNSRSLQDLADEFRITRQSNLYVFRNLTEEQLNRSGTASGNHVTVRALIFMTAGHELHHLKILTERYL
jgi:uncharacterized damage-inducible protein DinB